MSAAAGEKAKYLTRAAIVQAFGGDQEAVDGANKYIASCRQRPADMIRYNSYSGMEEYLLIQGVKKDLHSRSKTMRTVEACGMLGF